MSVAAHQPRKRGYFEAEENEDCLQRLCSEGLHQQGYQKRARGGSGASPSGRCGPDYQASGAGAYAVGSGTLAALAALFPEMSDKVIADVLAEYGDNIDAAIKHLTDLRLAAAADPSGEQQQQAEPQPQQRQTSPPPHREANAAQQQQQRHTQQQSQQRTTPQESQRSAEEWVDVVVQQMSAASDLEDARRRASSLLQAFEQAALTHARSSGGGAGEEAEKLQGQLSEALRENTLLKRAVTIQNGRMQEMASAVARSGRSATGGSAADAGEAAQLRQALQELAAKCHALEVQNYSLALHLRQATDMRDPASAAGTQHFKNPDVF